MVGVEPIVHCICINPEGEGATVDQKLDVLRPVGDGVTRLDANMKGMVMITTPSVSSIQTPIWETITRQPNILDFP